MPASRARQGFGFDAAESPYHFVVIIPREKQGHVTVEERFNCGELRADDAAPVRPPQPKAYLDLYRWSRIAEVVRTQFNRRLRDEGVRPAQWKTPGETPLAGYFGKELVLLAWAVEDADPTLIPNMVANWLGLAPEERWWLYTTINATAGRPEHGRDRGWRKAIKIAFAENPAPGGSGSVSADVAPAIRLPLPVDPPPARTSEPTAPEGPEPMPPHKQRGRRSGSPHAQLQFLPEE